MPGGLLSQRSQIPARAKGSWLFRPIAHGCFFFRIGIDDLPLKVGVDRDQATASAYGLAKCCLGQDVFGACINRGVVVGRLFGPERPLDGGLGFTVAN